MSTLTQHTNTHRHIFLTYTCPTCAATVQVASSNAVVGHRCPAKRGNPFTTWKKEQ